MEGECLNSMDTNSHLPRNQFKAEIHLLRKARSTAVELMTLSHTMIFRSTPQAWVQFWLIWRCFCCCDVSTSQQRILPFAPGKKFWGAVHRLAAHDVSRIPVPGAIEILPARRSRCGRPWVFRHCAIAIPQHRSYVNKHFLHRKTRSKPIVYWKCPSFIKVFLNTMTLTLFQKVRSL